MKKFTLEVTESDDEKSQMNSRNDGFSAMEILGILEFKRDDILSQMKGLIKPDKITRNMIVDQEQSSEEKSTD